VKRPVINKRGLSRSVLIYWSQAVYLMGILLQGNRAQKSLKLETRWGTGSGDHPMLALPPDLARKFVSLLHERRIPSKQRSDYPNWLRYSLDCCHKYRLEPSRWCDFSAFAEKLRSKNQSEIRYRQARLAIAIYYQRIVDGSATVAKAPNGARDQTAHAPSNESTATSPHGEIRVGDVVDSYQFPSTGAKWVWFTTNKRLPRSHQRIRS
jgi:hypothetical protein